MAIYKNHEVILKEIHSQCPADFPDHSTMFEMEDIIIIIIIKAFW